MSLSLHISRRRVVGLLLFCVAVLVWNMALSSRRKYYSGKLVPVVQQDFTLEVNCPGKIEPKVQETVRAVLDGPKMAVHVKEGDVVKKGQLLMEIGDDNISIELNNKRVAYRNANVEYSKAVKDYELSKRLFRQLAIPQREVETAQQAMERSGQAVTSLRQELAATETKAKGVRVVSPLTGVVMKSFVETESQISSGKELFKVAQIDVFMVKGQVDELEIAEVKLGQDAIVTCDAFAGVVMKGKVGWIGAQAGEGAFADIPVSIDLIDTQKVNLKANISAEAKIQVGHLNQAIVIPSAAVRKSEGGTFVFLASRAGWLTRQPIVIQRQTLAQTIVKEGLSSSQFVLVPPEE